MSGDLERLLDRLEALLGEVETWDEPLRDRVFELLDHVDALHRTAVVRLGTALEGRVDELRAAHPAIGWLFDAYGVGVDERAAAEEALQAVRPYVDSHGGVIDVLDVVDGVVRVRMSGSCAGCSGSAATLREGVEQALREALPWFVGLQAEQPPAPAHEPPGPTLVQISRRRPEA